MMDGGALCNLVAQLGPIPEAALANMVFQILWALAYLKHEKRVHRDIKPSNLLINSRGEVKVTDFGVSAELQSSVQMCGTFVGTFKYMSPERIRNQPYNYASVRILFYVVDGVELTVDHPIRPSDVSTWTTPYDRTSGAWA